MIEARTVPCYTDDLYHMCHLLYSATGDVVKVVYLRALRNTVHFCIDFYLHCVVYACISVYLLTLSSILLFF